MKLSDLLDTKPFNALTIALALLIAISIILTPYAVRGIGKDVAVKVNDISWSSLSVSFEALNGYYPEDLLKNVDYFAWQITPIPF